MTTSLTNGNKSNNNNDDVTESTGLLLPNSGGADVGTGSASTTNDNMKKRCCFGLMFLLIGACLGSFTTIFALWIVGRTPTWISQTTTTTTTTASHSTTKRNSKYTSTQLVSFSINTLGGVAEFGECVGRYIDPDDGLCYIGNDKNLTEDVAQRYRILETVIHAMSDDALNEYPKIDHSPNVLKIFMVPEFYWRGPNGAYSVADMGKGGALELLGDAFIDDLDDPKFENWLFVFGTVIVAQSPHDPNNPWQVDSQHIEKGDILYFNFAPVFKGGKDILNNRYIISKNYISTADFLNRASGLPDPRESHVSQYTNLLDIANETLQEYWKTVRNVHVLPGNTLTIDGIKIGVEICLDHRLSVLWDELQHSTNEEDLVDVHLVVSAGMSLERGPTPIKRRGVAYLTDGEASSSVCQRTDDDEYDPLFVCRASRKDGPDGLKLVPRYGDTKGHYSPYVELSSCINPDDAPWKPLMEGYYTIHNTQGCAFTLKMHGIDVYDEMSFYPPSIEIYPTIDLPAI